MQYFPPLAGLRFRKNKQTDHRYGNDLLPNSIITFFLDSKSKSDLTSFRSEPKVLRHDIDFALLSYLNDSDHQYYPLSKLDPTL